MNIANRILGEVYFIIITVVDWVDIFEGAVFTYYGEDHKEATVVDLATTNNFIKTGSVTEDEETKEKLYTGLFVTFNSKTAAFVSSNFNAGNVLIDVEGKSDAANSVDIATELAKGSVGSVEELAVGGYEIKNCPQGNSGTLVMTFTDALGIKTEYQIGYKK